MEKFTQRAHGWLKRHSFFRTAIIFVLIFLCAFELDAIRRGFETGFPVSDLSVRYQHGHIVRTGDITVPSDIQPWMTFQYVNFIFKLPPAYLSDSLSITDKRYPNLQIARYARMNNLPLGAFLLIVQQTVAAYSPTTQ